MARAALVVLCAAPLAGHLTPIALAQTATATPEPTPPDGRQYNVSVFMADLPGDRFLLEPVSILRNPLGLMLLEKTSRALLAASPKTCVVPPPPAPTTEGAAQLTAQDVTDDLMVQAFLSVLEKIETKRWAQVDAPKRDSLMRAALTDGEFEVYRTVVRSALARDAMTLREFRLEADAAVELGIAFDRFLLRAKYLINGPLNPLESRKGLETFDKLLEQVEDGFVVLINRADAAANFDLLMSLEARRALALLDQAPGAPAVPDVLPLRPKLKHILSAVALDADDLWQPMIPVFERLCIPKRTASP